MAITDFGGSEVIKSGVIFNKDLGLSKETLNDYEPVLGISAPTDLFENDPNIVCLTDQSFKSVAYDPELHVFVMLFNSAAIE